MCDRKGERTLRYGTLGCLTVFFIDAGVTQIPCLRDICRLDRFVFPDMTTPPRAMHTSSDVTCDHSLPPFPPSSLSRVFRREDRTIDKRSYPCRLQPLQNESGRRPRGRPAARQTDTFDHRRPAVATGPPPSGRPPPPSPRWSGARREERGSDRCGAHDRREPGVERAAGDRLRVFARRDQTLVRACAYHIHSSQRRARKFKLTDYLCAHALRFIEEPTAPDDILGHAAIRRALKPLGIGVATGEHAHNRMVFKQLFQADAIDVCQIDSCRLAGVSEVLSVLFMATK